MFAENAQDCRADPCSWRRELLRGLRLTSWKYFQYWGCKQMLCQKRIKVKIILYILFFNLYI